MSKKIILRLLLALFVIALPFTLHAIYRWMTAYPEQIVLATGPEHGRYHQVGQILAAHIEEELGIKVEVRSTPGSLENYDLLKKQGADFALFQAGTRHFIEQQQLAAGDVLKKQHRRSGERGVAFVANLYSEVVHLLVRRDVELAGPEDFRGKVFSLGQERSGDYVMGASFLKHLGLTEADVQPLHVDYETIEKKFRDQSLDVALITSGLGAPIYRDLLSSGICRLEPIPFLEAYDASHLAVSIYTVPRGYYRTSEPREPSADVMTAAFRAQLLTHDDVPSQLVQQVTRLVLSEDFMREAQLRELFDGGREYARTKPEFSIHAGANTVYEPELRPFLDPDFVEATEGMRSFLVSIAIAIYLAFRWWKKYSQQQVEHRLDRYIRSLLEIERRQLSLDGLKGQAEANQLQKLLDEVTMLRQEALETFSAHQLNEDRSTDCFLEMCHALSDKINAKLTRERLETLLREIIAGRGGDGANSVG